MRVSGVCWLISCVLGADLAPGGVEGAEQVEGVGAEAARFGVVDDELLAGCLAYVERLVGERERADIRVEEVFGVLRLASHGVGLPQAREVRAVLGEGADEFAQPRVVRFEAGRLAEVGGGGLCRPVPVRVEGGADRSRNVMRARLSAGVNAE
ncbi:hypothetical protein Z951_44675 [Streptomyces sp. PRh5]|nr:hypothetical protein Z951_44675 [Streptomyces sp. PRh5]